MLSHTLLQIGLANSCVNTINHTLPYYGNGPTKPEDIKHTLLHLNFADKECHTLVYTLLHFGLTKYKDANVLDNNSIWNYRVFKRLRRR